MQRWLVAVALTGCLGSTPVWAHSSKRTDPCGCHHQWGLRHCHPTKKTVSCEAPASAEKAAEKPAKAPVPEKPPAPVRTGEPTNEPASE